MEVATLTIELDGENCFVVVNAIRIAKRGNELNWFSLEPGRGRLEPFEPQNHQAHLQRRGRPQAAAVWMMPVVKP